MVRYTSDGNLDLSFSDDGVVRGESGRSLSSILFQKDGKIISTDGIGLTRYMSDGSRDSGFYSTNSISSGNYYNNIKLQSDGAIIAAGYSTTIDDLDIIVTRLKENGEVDKLFGLPVDTITGVVRYTENSQPVVLSSSVQIDDKDLVVSGSYAGATLTLTRQGGANVHDVFANTGTLSVLKQGSFFAVDGVTIGRVTINGEGKLVLEFNTNASQSLVNKAMQQIAYSNSTDAPPSSVAIDWTFNDGNMGAQGTGGALSVTGTTTVTITAVNDAPYLASPIAVQRAAIGLTFRYQLPQGTFIDPDLDALSYTVTMADGTGVPPWLTFDRTTLTFSGTPTASDLGLIDLQIKATDTSGASASSSFKITVFRNSPPVSTGATTSCAEDTVLSGILPTATDANGDTITYARAANPANGSVAVSANGSYTYTPDANFNGTDSFTFTVSDGNGSSNTYTQTITVTAVNDAPVATGGTLSATEDTAATGTLVATDVDNTALTYSVVTQPAKGTVTLGANGAYTYTPAKDANGSDSFTFRASDGALSSNTATVTITVAAVNDAPTAANATGSTNEDGALTSTLPAATDVDGNSVTYAKATNPSNGTATVTPSGSYTYTPTANYNGPDSFTYTVSDGQGGSNTYAVSLTVAAVDDAPVAAAGTLSVIEDTAGTDTLVATDVDSTTLTYSVVTQPAKGTVTLGENAAYTYTPAKDANGADSFTFRASDGALSSNTAKVTITVAPVNDAPVVALPLPDQNSLAGSAFAYTFPGNAFTDVDSAVLTYSASLSTGATLPAWLSFNPATRTFSGDPGTTNVGSIDVRVTASDGSLSASDVFSIAVSDRPLATSFQPADGAKSVPVGSNLLVTFNGPVQRGTGAITLKSADGKVVETFTASNATASGNTLTLNPAADLNIFTKYVVELGAGAVKDAAGNDNVADSRYDFQTATQDGLYHFFVVAFAAAPGATYMGQLAEAVNFGLPLDQIVEIFTTKKQFTDVYPSTMTNRELATQLVNNIVKNSASAATKQSAIDDIDAALGIGWSRGKMLSGVRQPCQQAADRCDVGQHGQTVPESAGRRTVLH